jgi:hypothetical protein
MFFWNMDSSTSLSGAIAISWIQFGVQSIALATPFEADERPPIGHVAAVLPNPACGCFNQIVFSQNHLSR